MPPSEVEKGASEFLDRGGIDAFIRGVSQRAWMDYINDGDTARFIREIGERYAFIRLEDITRPRRFLQQMAGAPPVQIGPSGFRADLLDDYNPARHYTALLFVGFYMPVWIATLVLLMWEIAGFVRYRGAWSWPDIRSGIIGIRHGRLVRRYGSSVLPGLIAAELVDDETA